MRILICSDGMDPEDKPVRLAGLLAAPCAAAATLLGIAELSQEEKPLRDALESEAEKLRSVGVEPEIVLRTGEPIREILHQTTAQMYDLTIIGARRKGTTGLYWRAEKTYEVIKAIPSPVMLATGRCETLRSFVVCTGGKKFIDAAVQLTGKVAAAVGASVTLLHVMAEPPAIYADLVRLEEDVEHLLESGSELGRNLLSQKQSLERLGVATEVRVRHGLVLNQVFAEVNERNHDLIVAGSSPTRGPLGHYIMGDLTRSIVNRANVPVLVARAEKTTESGRPSFWSTLKQIFASSRDPGRKTTAS
ncbi:MAG TPA: universal stress protein [Chthoniobacterales bacterium]|jgi:nucleotide-binding universal stress UspA family protein